MTNTSSHFPSLWYD